MQAICYPPTGLCKDTRFLICKSEVYQKRTPLYQKRTNSYIIANYSLVNHLCFIPAWVWDNFLQLFVVCTGKELYSGMDNSVFETKIYYADSTGFNIFTYNFIEGSGAHALNEPNNILISKTLAEKYFGKERPFMALH